MSEDALFLLGACAGLIATLVVIVVVRAIRNAEPLDSFGKKRKQ